MSISGSAVRPQCLYILIPVHWRFGTTSNSLAKSIPHMFYQCQVSRPWQNIDVVCVEELLHHTSCARACTVLLKQEREIFYLTTHSTHFIYGYMASVIWLRTILIVRKETRCRHIGYSYRLAAKDLLYAPSHRPRPLLHQLWSTGWNEC